jgi:hypothetical protein
VLTMQAIAFVSALFSNPALRNVTKPDSDKPKVCYLNRFTSLCHHQSFIKGSMHCFNTALLLLQLLTTSKLSTYRLMAAVVLCACPVLFICVTLYALLVIYSSEHYSHIFIYVHTVCSASTLTTCTYTHPCTELLPQRQHKTRLRQC